jgi:hypothetical protein
MNVTICKIERRLSPLDRHLDMGEAEGSDSSPSYSARPQNRAPLREKQTKAETFIT